MYIRRSCEKTVKYMSERFPVNIGKGAVICISRDLTPLDEDNYLELLNIFCINDIMIL